MNHTRLLAVLFVASVILLAACEKEVVEHIDPGTVTDSIYRNEYFGLSVTIPTDWAIQDQESLRHIMEKGGRMLAGDDENLNDAVKRSDTKTITLFAASKHPLGAAVPYNPSIICLAERLSHLPGVKSAEDYRYHTRNILESSHLKVSFPDGRTATSLGMKEFSILRVGIPVMDTTVHQKHYATIIKGCALVFVVSYTTDEEESSLNNILDSMLFT